MQAKSSYIVSDDRTEYKCRINVCIYIYVQMFNKFFTYVLLNMFIYAYKC